MTGSGVSRKVARALAAALLAGFVFSGNAVAQVTNQEAKRQIEDSYDVEVLRVREGEIDGRGVWLVTVMLPAGNFNTAFMVSRLAIDRQTGDLVPSFRHRASGYDLPGGRRNDKVGLRPDAARSRTWR
jgi:hypothetical protein